MGVVEPYLSNIGIVWGVVLSGLPGGLFAVAERGIKWICYLSFMHYPKGEGRENGRSRSGKTRVNKRASSEVFFTFKINNK